MQMRTIQSVCEEKKTDIWRIHPTHFAEHELISLFRSKYLSKLTCFLKKKKQTNKMVLLRKTTCDVQTHRNVEGRAFKNIKSLYKIFPIHPHSISLPPSFLPSVKSVGGRGPDPPRPLTIPLHISPSNTSPNFSSTISTWLIYSPKTHDRRTNIPNKHTKTHI